MERGEGFLEIKREQILHLIKRVKNRYEVVKQSMREAVAKAFSLLNGAYMKSGKELVKILAETLKRTRFGDVKLAYRATLGIDLPNLIVTTRERAKFPPYGFQNTSVYLDEAIRAFQEAFLEIMKYAEVEGTLLAYVFEYQKISRRLTALRDIKIPQMREEYKKIEETLEELEQEEFIRMRAIKNTIAARKIAGAPSSSHAAARLSLNLTPSED